MTTAADTPDASTTPASESIQPSPEPITRQPETDTSKQFDTEASPTSSPIESAPTLPPLTTLTTLIPTVTPSITPDSHTHSQQSSDSIPERSRDEKAAVSEEDSGVAEDAIVDPAAVRVSHACSNCKRAKTKCNNQRPCRRCTRLGRSQSCIDSIHQKRGRKPNRHKMMMPYPIKSEDMYMNPNMDLMRMNTMNALNVTGMNGINGMNGYNRAAVANNVNEYDDLLKRDGTNMNYYSLTNNRNMNMNNPLMLQQNSNNIQAAILRNLGVNNINNTNNSTFNNYSNLVPTNFMTQPYQTQTLQPSMYNMNTMNGTNMTNVNGMNSMNVNGMNGMNAMSGMNGISGMNNVSVPGVRTTSPVTNNGMNSSWYNNTTSATNTSSMNTMNSTMNPVAVQAQAQATNLYYQQLQAQQQMRLFNGAMYNGSMPMTSSSQM